jgi:hypothetical protein
VPNAPLGYNTPSACKLHGGERALRPHAAAIAYPSSDPQTAAPFDSHRPCMCCGVWPAPSPSHRSNPAALYYKAEKLKDDQIRENTMQYRDDTELVSLCVEK